MKWYKMVIKITKMVKKSKNGNKIAITRKQMVKIVNICHIVKMVINGKK